MEDVGARRSAIDIRERVDALVPAMMTSVEQTADRVRAEASDGNVRRRALRFKIDLVPAIYEAGFRADPLAAALDLWLLSYQIEGCLEAGSGPCDFGPQQAAARLAARGQREALDGLFAAVSLNRDALEWEREFVRDTARRHPLQDQGSLRQRRAITSELARTLNPGARDPFETLGDVSTTLNTLSSRLNLYIEEVARLSRWNAEQLAEDVAGWPAVDHALGDLGRVSASAERLSSTLEPERLIALLDEPVAAVRQERQAAMEAIDQQRVLTLQYLTKEREILVESLVSSLMSGLDRERVAAMAELRKERLATLDEVERLRRDMIADGSAEARRLADHVAWRLVQILGGAVVLVAILLWALRRPISRAAPTRGA